MESSSEAPPSSATPLRVASNAPAPGPVSGPFPAVTYSLRSQALDLDGVEPIRGQLLGVDHLDQHARWLASESPVAPRRRTLWGPPLRFLRHFDAVSRQLAAAHQEMARSSRDREVLPPAAEWFLDNFHIIEETVREVRTDLPGGFYHQLPKIATGDYAGLPRVYALALELIAHTDSGLDEANLTRFVASYQALQPLQIGELWAVPIMLRVVLLENLMRLARQILQMRHGRTRAEAWVQRRLAGEIAEGTPACDSPDDAAYLVQVLQSLRDRGLTVDLDALEQWLARRHTNSAEVLRREYQRQAADQITISNCVTSLRLLANLDWTRFFERTSLVEARLQEDPAGVYPRQDFPTKDRYRKRVEQLARAAGREELEVVELLLERCRAAHPADPRGLQAHVGDWLIGPSRDSFARQVGERAGLRGSLQDFALRRPGLVYFGPLAALIGLGLWGCGTLAAGAGAPAGVVALALLAALLPVSELAVSTVHFCVTRLLPPRVLPKLDFKDGIPEDCGTCVVIPTLLGRPEAVRELVERLEIHYLSNPDPRLHFALLTDFTDAAREELPGDAALVQTLLDAVAALNRRHPREGRPRFHALHRPRRWNPAEGCWMGWERKRGKLQEFNRLLRGEASGYAWVSPGFPDGSTIRYVITLDGDTRMPRETARRLVATLAHPLNRARQEASSGRVVGGYGLLQPRVSLTIEAGRRSRFSRAFAFSRGLDPYTSAVSDVYQDLFGRGTFTGKGIYDVDAFEAATGHRFPENRILSHDLIEGNFARCGLATDIELVDDFPAKYHAYARREHRWIRGDWQIAAWLFRRPPAPTPSGRGDNPLPLLERWKILDNLRRSLVPAGAVLLFLLGWLVLPGPVAVWTGLALLAVAMPLMWLLDVSITGLLLGRMRREEWHDLPLSLRSTGEQLALTLIFLPNQAAQALDAIGRVFWRLHVSGRKRLEWETAAAAEDRLGLSLGTFLRAMWAAPLVAVLGLAGLFAAGAPAATLLLAAPVLGLWLISPWVAWRSSQPLAANLDEALTDEQRRELRRIARKTWFFFEQCVTAQDHWLPPDNYQEHPKGVLAHRTSPTNMGLYLLSSLAAHDFGYLSRTGLAQRLGDTLDTFERLERDHGHFYNWYETTTLQVLSPPYLSTVDSGNLLGCLIALRQGLIERAQAATPPQVILAGLRDGVRVLEELLNRFPAGPVARELQPAREPLERLSRRLEDAPTDAGSWPAALEALAGLAGELRQQVHAVHGELIDPLHLVRDWSARLESQARGWLADLQTAGGEQAEQLHALARRAERFAREMDFTLLYNATRDLFSIGLNRAAGKLDQSHYDLLASEAVLTSFLAVARGDAPKKHWFQLGRLLTRSGRGVALVSWGGTMFEYLMPRLLLRTPPGTLIQESLRGAIARQIDYGREARVPWGISESGFNALDAGLDYQYQSFGVPGLGLKRGLTRDLVIAPYATGLADQVRPASAARNFEELKRERAEGPMGFYEAIDYTQARLGGRRRSVVVQSYMAHHQGMILTALANALFDDIMVTRFHREPMVRATDLLLQERLPQVAPLVEADEAREGEPERVVREVTRSVSRRLTTADTPHPRTHLLSNGTLSVMLTNSGGGSTRMGEMAVSRWSEDPTLDEAGQFVLLHEPATGRVWSAAAQPLPREAADSYEVIFSADKAQFRRRDGELETDLEVTVSPEHPAEVRWLTLTNHGGTSRVVDCTSYLEVVLLAQRADLAHPAFGKLFLETEWLPAQGALLCRRRPRSAAQRPIWAVHVITRGAGCVGETTCETDRARFLGRGRTLANADALRQPLSGTTGPVLDPIFSLRQRVEVAPGARAEVAFTTLVANSREEAVALADRYRDPHAIQRAFELAWAHTRVQLQHLHLSDEDAHLYQRLASYLVYPGSLLRVQESLLLHPRASQAGLWRHGISGDRPILLVSVSDPANLTLARQAILAHAYWRLQGLEVDLVLLNEHPTSYQDGMQQHLTELIRANHTPGLIDRPGGIFIRRADTLTPEDRNLLLASARAVLFDTRGSMETHLDRREPHPSRMSRIVDDRQLRGVRFEPLAPEELECFNGTGGFAADGREYCIPVAETPRGLRFAPAPWINVVANPQCGFTASERGGGCTWAVNSQLNRLTGWRNDPVGDAPSEALYLRDEESGLFWSATPLPCGGPTRVAHGFGYTRYQAHAEGVRSDWTLFVPTSDPVKVMILKLHNDSARARTLSVTFYAEWTLGTTRDATAMHLCSQRDGRGPLLARNPFQIDFGGRVAFLEMGLEGRIFSADRLAFLGRNGSLREPAGMARPVLEPRLGAGFDPCGLVQGRISLQPGESREVVILLGQAEDAQAAQQLCRSYSDPASAAAALRGVTQSWERTLGAVRVETPLREWDLLLNGWLAYQSLACRVIGRTALYQSGGAYGFRDQLQDVMALIHAAPRQAEEQILRACRHQFPEGDVLHWWHPPRGQGVRTRFSDDFLWLPLAVERAVRVTGDRGLLERREPFLTGPALAPHQEESYFQPGVSEETATVREHCLRAIDHGLRTGPHGLPLIGIGDWNDGMNQVGHRGTGESVWNAWFLLTILPWWLEECRRAGDGERAERYSRSIAGLREAVESAGWDGEWYRRAYFDDGTPLGSRENSECRIDAIAQSWAVISGAADPGRARRAMAAVDRELVRREQGLILLFTPPFDRSELEPGYIKGYLPGIRENGGQYTHAAVWTVYAFALLGEGAKARELFEMISPLRATRTPEAVERYRVEPYVVAADVYGVEPNVGRGGWTWYTGSAGWMLRVGLEAILGLRREGDELWVEPCIDPAWGGFRLTYRHLDATYDIRVSNPEGVSGGVASMHVNGVMRAGPRLRLEPSGSYEVLVVLGALRTPLPASPPPGGTREAPPAGPDAPKEADFA